MKRKNDKSYLAWKGYNKNVVSKAQEIKNNMDKTVGMTFPPEMPVLFFTTTEDKVNEDGKSNITFYQTQ